MLKCCNYIHICNRIKGLTFKVYLYFYIYSIFYPQAGLEQFELACLELAESNFSKSSLSLLYINYENLFSVNAYAYSSSSIRICPTVTVSNYTT